MKPISSAKIHPPHRVRHLPAGCEPKFFSMILTFYLNFLYNFSSYLEIFFRPRISVKLVRLSLPKMTLFCSKERERSRKSRAGKDICELGFGEIVTGSFHETFQAASACRLWLPTFLILVRTLNPDWLLTFQPRDSRFLTFDTWLQTLDSIGSRILTPLTPDYWKTLSIGSKILTQLTPDYWLYWLHTIDTIDSKLLTPLTADSWLHWQQTLDSIDSTLLTPRLLTPDFWLPRLLTLQSLTPQILYSSLFTLDSRSLILDSSLQILDSPDSWHL